MVLNNDYNCTKKIKNNDYNKKPLNHFAVGMVSDGCNKKPLGA
jgi:hypothetical protein